MITLCTLQRHIGRDTSIANHIWGDFTRMSFSYYILVISALGNNCNCHICIHFQQLVFPRVVLSIVDCSICGAVPCPSLKRMLYCITEHWDVQWLVIMKHINLFQPELKIIMSLKCNHWTSIEHIWNLIIISLNNKLN